MWGLSPEKKVEQEMQTWCKVHREEKLLQTICAVCYGQIEEVSTHYQQSIVHS